MNEQIISEIRKCIDDGEVDFELVGSCRECGGMLNVTFNLDDPDEPVAWFCCEECDYDKDVDITPDEVRSLTLEQLGELFMLDTESLIDIV